MTLLISIASPNGIWQAADCRLSGGGISKNYTGTKLCRLETPNSIGVIGYSGLGAMVKTSNGKVFEVSEWLKKCLQGKKRSLDESISQIIKSANFRNIHKQVDSDHTFVVASFDSKVARLDTLTSSRSISINNLRSKTINSIPLTNNNFNWHKAIANGRHGGAISIDGNGRMFVHQDEIHRISHLISEAKKSREHTNRVNAYLAQIIRNVSKREKKDTVGPECLSICIQPDKTSWSRFYDKNGKVANGPGIPAVAVGIPVDDLINAIGPIVEKHLAGLSHTSNNNNVSEKLAEELQNAAEKVDDRPDDRLLR